VKFSDRDQSKLKIGKNLHCPAISPLQHIADDYWNLSITKRYQNKSRAITHCNTREHHAEIKKCSYLFDFGMELHEGK
jgi:hypothetical protein